MRTLFFLYCRDLFSMERYSLLMLFAYMCLTAKYFVKISVDYWVPKTAAFIKTQPSNNLRFESFIYLWCGFRIVCCMLCTWYLVLLQRLFSHRIFRPLLAAWVVYHSGSSRTAYIDLAPIAHLKFSKFDIQYTRRGVRKCLQALTLVRGGNPEKSDKKSGGICELSHFWSTWSCVKWLVRLKVETQLAILSADAHCHHLGAS